MNPQEVIRGYTGSDANMTESARVIRDLFVIDLPAFTAFDSTLTTAFATQYLTKLVAAEQVVDDIVVIDQIVTSTEQAESQLELAQDKYIDVKYFVQKAFPTSKGTQGEFGLNDYENIRRNKTGMASFLDELNKTCNKYKTQLIAAGFSQANIDSILTIRTNLLAKNSTQKLLKKQRPNLTEDRIIILNDCYQMMVLVNAAAQRVYRNEFAKQKQYVFVASSADDTDVFVGNVPAATTQQLAVVEYDETTTVSFKNTGTASLTFALSTSANLEGNQVPLAGGAKVVFAMIALLPNGTNLIVKNNDPAVAGSYEVTVTD